MIFFDPAARTALKAAPTVSAGNVVFEDDASETPRQFAQRFNVGLDAKTPDFAAALAADANFDDVVNVLDLAALANHYGLAGAEWIDGDFNNDGAVSVHDLAEVANHYGHTAGRGSGAGRSPVPEPGALILLSLGALAAGRRRRG